MTAADGRATSCFTMSDGCKNQGGGVGVLPAASVMPLPIQQWNMVAEPPVQTGGAIFSAFCT